MHLRSAYLEKVTDVLLKAGLNAPGRTRQVQLKVQLLTRLSRPAALLSMLFTVASSALDVRLWGNASC